MQFENFAATERDKVDTRHLRKLYHASRLLISDNGATFRYVHNARPSSGKRAGFSYRRLCTDPPVLIRRGRVTRPGSLYPPAPRRGCERRAMACKTRRRRKELADRPAVDDIKRSDRSKLFLQAPEFAWHSNPQ